MQTTPSKQTKKSSPPIDIGPTSSQNNSPAQISSAHINHHSIRQQLPQSFSTSLTDYSINHANKEENAFIAAADEGDLDKLLQIINEGYSDFNAADRQGNTAFMLAAQNGHQHIVKQLLHLNVNANAVNNIGSNALGLAAENGHLDLVLLLIGTIHLDQADQDGFTPLMLACIRGHLKVAKCLLEQGANMDLLDQKNCTAIQWANFRGNEHIVNLLIRYGAEVEQLRPEKFLDPTMRTIIQSRRFAITNDEEDNVDNNSSDIQWSDGDQDDDSRFKFGEIDFELPIHEQESLASYGLQDTSKECLQDHITQAKSEQGRKEKRDQLLGVVVNEPNPVATWNLLQASQSLKISTQLHNPFVCWTSIQLSDFFSEKQALIRDMILLSLNLPNAADFTPAIYECFLSYTSAANNSSANTDNHLLNHVKDHHVITPIYSALKPVAECLKNTELKKLLAQSTQPTTRQYQTIAMCLLYKSAESININVYATYNQVEFSFFESLQTGINAYKTQLLAYTEIRIQENLHIPLKNICNEISNYIDIEKQILKREELFNTLINTVGLPTQIANNFVATTESILKKYFALPSQTDFLSYWKNNFQTARKEHSQTQFETERLFYRLTDQFPPLLQDALNTIEQAILQNVQSAGE